jgi:hypothetical protein
MEYYLVAPYYFLFSVCVCMSSFQLTSVTMQCCCGFLMIEELTSLSFGILSFLLIFSFTLDE